MNLASLDFRKNKITYLQIGLLIGISLGLRFVYLGYSNFQGDEINALCRVADFKSRYQFLIYLLGQRKGPVQFLLTCALSLVNPSFSSELLFRLPFAIANLLALICFLLLVYRLFSLEAAIYSSFLFATNGIFVAFARIVQYQSMVLLGGIAGILGLTLALQNEKWKVIGLYVGLISVAIGLLTHFDAAFMMPPVAVLLIYWWKKYSGQPDFARLRLHLIAALFLFAFLVLAFYIPYAERLGRYQTDYWQERFTGDTTNIFRVFEFYNPGPVLWLCLIVFLIGLMQIRNTVAWQVLIAWIMPPIIFMVMIFKDSRTHAYTYLLPLLIVAGIGFETILRWSRQWLRGRFAQLVQAISLGVLLLFAYISYEVMVDHSPEYPWYPKQLLGMNLDESHVAGIFGFPYSRNWREIGQWFETLPKQDTIVVLNEKLDFPTFYLPSNIRYKYITEESPGKIKTAQGIYILLVQNSWIRMNTLWGWSVDEWHRKLTPLHDFINQDGRIVASVYFLTPEQIDANFH